MNDFISALALLLIFEGLLLFGSPKKIFLILETLSRFSEKKIRIIGATSVIIGILIIYIIRY